MKNILRYALTALALLASSPAWAANIFWVGSIGSSDNWSTVGATNRWATTSGGSDHPTLTTGDTVIFDANSGTGTSNIDTSISIAGFNASASTAVTLTHGGVTVTVTGAAITFNSTIIYQGFNSARVWSANPTGTNTLTITSAGQRFGALTINGATGATVTLADALRVDVSTPTSVLTVTQGIFTANNQNVTAGNFASSNTNTRTVTMGSGTWTLVGDDSLGYTWDTSTTTGLTFNKNTSTLSFTNTGLISVTFNSGAPTGGFNIVNFGANSTGTFFSIVGGPTIATLGITAPNYIRFQAGLTTTISNAFAWTGTSSNPILIASSSAGISPAAITTGSATSNTAAWTGFNAITFTPVGGSTLNATNSLNFGGNSGTGFTITPPSTGGGGRIIGG